MRIKTLFIFLSIGIIFSFIVGAVVSFLNISAHSYFTYKMTRLAIITLQENLNNHMIYFIGILSVMFFSLLAAGKKFKWKEFKLIKFNIIGIIILVFLSILNFMVKNFIGYNLFLASKAFFARIIELLTTNLAFSVFVDIITQNIEGIILVSSGFLIFILVLYFLNKKIDWERQTILFKKGFGRHKIISLVLCMVLVLLNLGMVIKSSTTTLEEPNIVFILIDSLRADHLSCYGYERKTSPTIDKIAEEGIIFENAYSHSAWTKPSVASLFSSLYPYMHTVINLENALPKRILTIAEILKNKGYKTYFYNGGNRHLYPRFNLNQGFDLYDNSDLGEDLTDKFSSQVNKLRKNFFFAYLHYMDVYLPYHKNEYNSLFTSTDKSQIEPGNILMPEIRELTRNNEITDEGKEYIESLYDGQISYIDFEINELISFFKQLDLLKDTIFIITSDHGEEFWDHNNFEHGHTLYEEIIHVPLIIYGPELEHSRITSKVGLVDLFPSILNMTETKVYGLDLNGISLFPVDKIDSGDSRLPIFSTGTIYGDEKYCILKDNLKYILNTGEQMGKIELTGYSSDFEFEVYNLESDPLEMDNLINVESEAISQLEIELTKYIAVSTPFKSEKVYIDKELKEKLKALGYLK